MAQQNGERRQQPRRSARQINAAAQQAPDQLPAKRRKVAAQKAAPAAKRPRKASLDDVQAVRDHQVPSADASPAPEASPAGINAYEAARQAQIAKNLARMAALQLPELAKAIARAPRPKAPTKRAKPAPPSEALPLRQSARVRGVGPDGVTAAGVAHEGRGGRITLLAAASAGATAAAAEAELAAGPVPFQSRSDAKGGPTAADAAFLELLKRSAGSSSSGRGGSDGSDGSGGKAAAPSSPRARAKRAGAAAQRASGAAAGDNSSIAALSKLQLRSEDVAKMTRDGITCVEFHPSCSSLVVAACDKSGKVSLWDIDHTPVSDDDDTHGILSFAAHAQYVSSLHWAGGSGLSAAKLYTSSYDGTIRILDPGSGAFLRADLQGLGPGDEISAMDVGGDGEVAWLGDPEGHMAVADLRAGKLMGSWTEVHNKKINTLQLEPGSGRLLASSCSDGTVSIWDVRKLGQPAEAAGAKHTTKWRPLAQVHHTKSSQGACWAPDGSCRLLSISFDDTLRVWSGAAGTESSKWEEGLRIRHNNNTGRWVTPFRPMWGPAADCVIVGNMRRGIDIISASTGREEAVLSNADAMTAIASRYAVKALPGGAVALAAGTSSGRCCIYR